MTASESDLRVALWVAHGALLHASKWLQGEYAKGPETHGAKVQVLVNDALAHAARVLDEDRDESNEQGGT